MRIAELSRRSEVTVATIKYYLRERLLPPGTASGRNQADYDEQHLQRLRLIRALREVGGLPVAAVRDVLEALDEPAQSGHELMGRAHRAVLGPAAPNPTDPQWAAARAEAEQQLDRLEWQVGSDTPALDQLADVILALRRLDRQDLLDALPVYAAAALAVAQPEVAAAAATETPAAAMTAVVTGTVLGGALLAALRLLAHEHASATQLTPATGGGGC